MSAVVACMASVSCTNRLILNPIGNERLEYLTLGDRSNESDRQITKKDRTEEIHEQRLQAC